MIIDMDLHIVPSQKFSKFSNPAFLAGVHQNEPFDLGEVNPFYLGKIKYV